MDDCYPSTLHKWDKNGQSVPRQHIIQASKKNVRWMLLYDQFPGDPPGDCHRESLTKPLPYIEQVHRLGAPHLHFDEIKEGGCHRRKTPDRNCHLSQVQSVTHGTIATRAPNSKVSQNIKMWPIPMLALGYVLWRHPLTRIIEGMWHVITSRLSWPQ